MDSRRIAASKRRAVPCMLSEGADRRPGQILDRDMRHGNAIPVPADLAHQEPVDRRPLQRLVRAATAVVVLALVIDRVVVDGDRDLHGVFPGIHPQIDVHDDPQNVAHLVRDVLQELAGVPDPDSHTLVVTPDGQHAASGVGEAADRLQAFVPPRLLSPDALGLFHAVRFLRFKSAHCGWR